MASERLPKDAITFKPVTIAEWPDLQALFAEKGPQQGCWCMYWRIKRAEYHRGFGEQNKADMQEIIESGRTPGILAYHQGQPIGWCSVAPRDEFPALDRSPTLKRVDREPVWSIVCFFVARRYRDGGLTTALIEAAIEHARENGARIVEAYPLIPEATRYPQYERYTGVISTFEKIGFEVVVQRSPRRPIMRYTICD
jgi:GNAT superfamily N-acetyltransferase